MAKRSKINGSIVSPDGIIALEQGKVYPDSIITEGVDESLFDTVSDAALETSDDATASEGSEEGTTTKKKSTRKTKSELE